MSAFFVGNKTLSKLANSLFSNFYKDFKELGAPSLLYDALYDLNVESLKARYSDYWVLIDEEKKFNQDCLGWVFDGNFITKEDKEKMFKDLSQFYMSLCCFLYQCSEGDIPENNELFKKLEKISDILAHKLAQEFSERQGAKWE